MTPNEYQELCQRTVMSCQTQWDRILTKMELDPNLSHVLIGALKLNSESGELADALVKHFCYNQELDIDNILEECGDLLWYIALIVEHLGSDLETIMNNNIEKLKIRYPEKYSDKDAAERKDKQ